MSGKRWVAAFSAKRKQDGHGVEAGADLDEEMEKVFAMASDEKFDVAKLATSPESTTSKRSIGEKEYAMHRKKSYPHMHMPLKSIHSRSMRKKVGSPPSESDGAETSGAEAQRSSRKTSQAGTESDSALSPPILSPSLAEDIPTSAVMSGSTSPEEKEDPVLLSSESEPQVSERAASYSDSPTFGSPTDALRRVQFQIGEIVEKPEGGDDEDGADKEQKDSGQDETSPLKDPEKKVKRKHSRHHHYHHHHRSRKYSLQEDPQWRLRSGSEFGIGEEPRVNVAKTEEGAELQELDLDDLASHRFDDARGLRRYKIKNKATSASVIHIGRKDGTEPLQSMLPLALKKMIDHSPHEVFVQLDELQGEGEEREWKETARWIKYEEDVEEGADRWGRPHVASLSFHSLLNLRRCLETGVVLLDLEEKDLPGVAYRVVEQMVVEELICAENKATVMRALLLRHRHVNDHDRFRFGMKRTFSSYTSLQNLSDEKGKPKVVSSISSMDAAVTSSKHNNAGSGEGEAKSENHVIDVKEELTYTSSNEDLKKAQKESILKRIPVGAEATTVLVGAVDFLEQPTIAFVRLAEGIHMPSITEVKIPVRFLFILLGPTTVDLDYHEIGRSISTLMSNSQFHKIAYRATERRELLSAINEFLDDSIVLPPGDWERKALLPFRELKAKSEMIRKRKNTRLLDEDEAKKVLLASSGDGKGPPDDDPLQRTKRPFGGLINDVKRRFPHYVSDFVDGCNLQCAAAAIFMYFAALSGAITFGGLMSDKTDNMIGIAETLLSTSAAGILFALLAGQPLIIVGTTGPLLLFDESLFSFCITNDIDFLTIRVYIGIWLGIIALVVVFFEGSVLVKLFTRFTEEIFAALISLLYIVESIMKLYMVFQNHPLLADYCEEHCNNVYSGITHNSSIFLNDLINFTVPEDLLDINETFGNSSLFSGRDDFPISPGDEHNWKNQPNTALFCLILALGTFFIAYYLRHFRNSKFLGRNARRALGDFGVPIAIITMVTLDYFTPTVYTEKLRVPEGLSPSKPSERGWFVSPSSSNVEIWVAFAACAPAILVYILLFMETHICELIVDKKDRKLKKGSGFHLDIVLICFLNVGMGFMGAPWVCAATVRSIAHVSAVTVMSRTHAPGESPHIIDVKEQRLSSLIVAVLVGISVLMAPLLRLVPISVLFGVFLYMGVSSTNGIQFFERLQLIFMPVKHHPQASYVRKVHSMKMHLFTFIQLLCLAVLWVVKSTEAALAFPFFLILMVPLRAQLRFLFTPSELRALDSEEADADEDEPDFYTEAPMPG